VRQHRTDLVTVSRAALAALTSIELREAELLAWGAVAAQWTEQEILEVVSAHGAARLLVDELVATTLLVPTPQGGYRSRAAETVRILATLRQSFPGRPVTDGRSLVLDYRFLHRPRRRPGRTEAHRAALLESLPGLTGTAGSALAVALLPWTASGFQARAAQSILRSLSAPGPSGVMITAGTGSGKSLAFYLPVLARIADLNEAGPAGMVKALAIYPRNELLKDQLRALLRYTTEAWAVGAATRPITVGAWFGPTPDDIRYFRPAQSSDWRAARVGGRDGYICPFLTCFRPDCTGDMIWTQADLNQRVERLTCSDCDYSVDDRFIRLTRRSAVDAPPDIMLTTTESLNRQLANPGNLRAFGVSQQSLRVVLLDELHVYEGIAGAQSAYLFRRLSQALGRPPVWVALSATLRRADEFLAQCVGLRAENITVVAPEAAEMVESGAEYLLALRHDPTSGTGTLSTTIQASMALPRCLDVLDEDPFTPPPTSEGTFGRKIFDFTDRLDTTNRLFWDLMNAEGWAWEGRRDAHRVILSLAHLRSEHQERMRAGDREPALDRDADGQWWWLAEHLGHGLDSDRQLTIGRTSSQDRGVSENAQVVVATSTLEVGFDDARVGAVLQHKAPHDAASFLQRKGRAGREPVTRPWTVVVLSDWGRDQAAWDAYDAMFNPELPAKSLPLDNRYVQRIQSVYALLDWLSQEVGAYARRGSIWSDLTGPADVLAPDRGQQGIRERQSAVRQALEALLSPGPARNRLRRHLRGALGLARDPRGDIVVDQVLFDGPRPILLTVVPTMIRRLRDDWLAERPQADDPSVKYRVPLRDFAPGNLFDDLSATDVAFDGPGLGNLVDAPYLPVLRTIRDFMPGTVSRHFGVRAAHKRHWVDVKFVDEGGAEVDVQTLYAGIVQGAVQAGGSEIPIMTPRRVGLVDVPPPVRDHSRVDPLWEVSLRPVGAGVALSLPVAVRQVFQRIRSHIHARGDGIRNVRFTRRATGSVFRPARSDLDLTFRDSAGSPVALGAEMVVDGFAVCVEVPQPDRAPSAEERADWLRWLLRHDAALPAGINRFARDTLAEAAQVVWARQALGGADYRDLSDDGLARQLKDAAFLLGRLRREAGAQPPEPAAGEDAGDDADSFIDDEWLESPEVMSSVRWALGAVLESARSADWISWWRRRYTVTAANALLGALNRLAHGLDADALVLDLDPDDETLAWITETGPGGIGAVESCLRAASESPELLSYALASSLMPTDVETMDAEMTAAISIGRQSARQACSGVIAAWRQGHEAARQALEQFYAALAEAGAAVRGASQTAISTRLLGPGAHPDLMDSVAGWLTVRERLARAGVHTNSRVLAAVIGSGPVEEDVLRLPPGASPQRRARAIANVLWPWGSDAAPQPADNIYADLPSTAPGAVRAQADFSPPVITISRWSADLRTAAHDALVQSGEVRLQFEGPRAEGRVALLDLQTTPVELDTLLVYPTVVGMTTEGPTPEAWLRLKESAT
jgi:PAS domain-containing protein